MKKPKCQSAFKPPQRLCSCCDTKLTDGQFYHVMVVHHKGLDGVWRNVPGFYRVLCDEHGRYYADSTRENFDPSKYSIGEAVFNTKDGTMVRCDPLPMLDNKPQPRKKK